LRNEGLRLACANANDELFDCGQRVDRSGYGAIGLCKFESFNRIVRAARRSNLADRVENLSETFSYQ
jgi:hypothetical protein